MAQFTAPAKGIVLTHFIVASDASRSRPPRTSFSRRVSTVTRPAAAGIDIPEVVHLGRGDGAGHQRPGGGDEVAHRVDASHAV